MLLAGACSNGGGGTSEGSDFSQDSVPVGRPLVVPPDSAQAQAYETDEFNAAGGLNQINAQHAYAEGATGAGTTVAVIDTGIDLDHPDLAQNIDPNSINIIDGESAEDVDNHGTAVAGIIAARKNDSGIHGVAFDANLLAIAAYSCDENCDDGTFFDSDLSDAIDYARQAGADVINLSLGGAGALSSGLETAIEQAATAGIIILASTGNDGETDPHFPAAFATDPDAEGLMIAVGAVDPNNVLADFSNACGAAMAFCLVAPGAPVLASRVGGGTRSFSGTSASAPYASGAAALLLSAFPELSARQIVEILLESASDLGAPGVDAVYGHGLINLYAAMQPIGELSVPLAEGGAAELAETALALGPAFGDALALHADLFGRALGLDKYDRAFEVDLSSALQKAAREIALEGFLAAPRRQTVELDGPQGLSVRLAVDDEAETGATAAAALRLSSEKAERRGGDVGPIAVTAALTQDASLHFGFRDSAAAHLVADPASEAAGGGMFLSGEEALSPHFALTGTGTGLRLEQRVSENTTLNLGWFEGDMAAASLPGDGRDETVSAEVYQFGLSRRLTPDLRLGANVALLQEDDSFLGTRSGGAFGQNSGATSQFLTLSADYRLTEGLDLFASYTQALTTMQADDAALLSDWSPVQSNAFGVGLAARELFAAGDRLGLMFSQPLRVMAAEADLTVPTSSGNEGGIDFATRREDLTPSGREISLQLGYRLPLRPGIALQGLAIGRLEPGHDAEADPDFGLGLRLQIRY